SPPEPMQILDWPAEKVTRLFRPSRSEARNLPNVHGEEPWLGSTHGVGNELVAAFVQVAAMIRVHGFLGIADTCTRSAVGNGRIGFRSPRRERTSEDTDHDGVRISFRYEWTSLWESEVSSEGLDRSRVCGLSTPVEDLEL